MPEISRFYGIVIQIYYGDTFLLISMLFIGA